MNAEPELFILIVFFKSDTIWNLLGNIYIMILTKKKIIHV